MGTPSEPAPTEPPPYAMPFLLRPVTAGNLVGIDVSIALARSTTTIPITWRFHKEIIPGLAAVLRWSIVHDVTVRGTSFVNPILGALYSIPLDRKRWTLGLFGGTTLPIGTGRAGDTSTVAANLAGRPARAAMDNATFDVDFIAPMLGAGIAYVTDRITAQMELTLGEHVRVRGAADGDKARTNLTAAGHFAFFPIRELSIGAEVRYQAWLVNGSMEIGNEPAAVDNWTIGIGPRGNFRLGQRDVWVRPAISFSMSLDAPNGFAGEQYKILQVDVPIVF
ncbi:hypothetical protein [Polyangium sp. 6x1]|uniref:hypothetical protein n=1 Tax=Polyangium sp. 6x1 TaxID=3042689 RepID=UPI002482E75C|nr:hypothetical protein [Polyangium sp. 6x1]MDI1444638.1 hypothetical protein [Polyangium sp. 6x1]